MKTKSELTEEIQLRVFLVEVVNCSECYQFPVLVSVLSVILLSICLCQTYTVGQNWFFFVCVCIYLETKESKLLPSLPGFPLCLQNGMWVSLAVKIGCKWWSPLSCYGWNLLWLLIESAQLQICVLVDLNSFRHIGQRYNQVIS